METKDKAGTIRYTYYLYNENSMLVKTQRPDGMVEARDYDKAGRLSYILDKKDETIINSYYADGNTIYVPLNGQKTTFFYDCRNRLMQAGDTTYQYDAENYRIGMTKNVGTRDEIKVAYVVDSGSGELSQVLKSVESDTAGNSKVVQCLAL